ncbi:hypothetical protein DFP72DRAFT_1076627 [Ephemerocybe angulata]|uniref:Uncharacterized protein n=1 Tax=Ephemerocybe angulata TaxID=980116 RepID=A0A8H6HH43_9AGAR|nr:hypothetical protein DFP72DRAFT_1076627 [Tulosesus angulatus]
MGRPRMYHSPEEVKEANKRKSKKYYDEHKVQINHVRYMKRRKLSANESTTTPQPPKRIVTEEEKHRHQVRYWVGRAESMIARTQDKLGGQTLSAHLTSICEQYKIESIKDIDAARETIVSHSARFGDVLQKIESCDSKLLNLVGVGQELKRVRDIRGDICTIIRAIDDLWSIAIVESDELIKDFDEGKLDFQLRGVPLVTM